MPRDGASARRMTVGRVEGETARGDAVRFINETLKGPVAEIFQSLIPAFGQMSGAEFYDTVMGSSELLHGCIAIFRRHRDAFKALLVDDRGRAVNDDFVRLRCGRSIHDIIAMILRTHAKRHFRMATRAAKAAYEDPQNWQARQPTIDGSWWPAWCDWLEARQSGEKIAPPTTGKPEQDYVPLAPAPGIYVLQT